MSISILKFSGDVSRNRACVLVSEVCQRGEKCDCPEMQFSSVHFVQLIHSDAFHRSQQWKRRPAELEWRWADAAQRQL